MKTQYHRLRNSEQGHSPSGGASPIEPGFGVSGVSREPAGNLPRNRADLILLFGVLSLFLCGPLGVIALIMGFSDLKKMRAGTISPEKKREIKIGMCLGVVGTVTSAVVFGYLWYAVPSHIFQPDDLLSAAPLTSDRVVFAGEWDGNRGSVIVIRPDGTGDFKTRNTSVKGGRVKIGKDTLSIGLLGVYKTWQITGWPHLEDGHWKMRLDGEVFTRKAMGHLVLS